MVSSVESVGFGHPHGGSNLRHDRSGSVVGGPDVST